ncbi:MAG: hypothetical protein IJV72_07370 [Clostridia bacterium]|nr:hypothetical protein [Clostridia bacterium]
MVKNKRVILAIVAAVAVILLSFITIKAFDIHFNVITYHSFEQDGYSFKFKGSANTVRKVIIKKDSKKVGSLPFDATSELFADEELEYSARLEDADGDGDNDIILPCAFDEDNDIHYTVYLTNVDGKLEHNENTKDLPNLSIDGEHLFTEQTTKEILLEKNTNSPEIYIRKHSITKYAFLDGECTALEERAIIYYAENDYYCYSVYAYDEEYGGLKYVDEKWFEPEDIDKYQLGWE